MRARTGGVIDDGKWSSRRSRNDIRHAGCVSCARDQINTHRKCVCFVAVLMVSSGSGGTVMLVREMGKVLWCRRMRHRRHGCRPRAGAENHLQAVRRWRQHVSGRNKRPQHEQRQQPRDPAVQATGFHMDMPSRRVYANRSTTQHGGISQRRLVSVAARSSGWRVPAKRQRFARGITIFSAVRVSENDTTLTSTSSARRAASRAWASVTGVALPLGRMTQRVPSGEIALR